MAVYDAADIASQSRTGDDTRLQQFERKFWREYLENTGLKPYMGAGNNHVIQVNKRNIQGGETVAIPLVQQLRGTAKGTGILTGNETQMFADDFLTRPNWVRDGVTITKDQKHLSHIDLMMARKETLKDLAADYAYFRALESFTSVGTSTTRFDAVNSIPQTNPIAVATNAEKSTWMDDNTDRVFFNLPNSGLRAPGDFDLSVTNLQAAAQPSAAQVLDALKDEAQRRNLDTGPTSRTAIRPIKVDMANRYRMFLVLVGTKTFNWIENDPTVVGFYQNAARNAPMENRYFHDGDIMYKGMVIREIPEFDGFDLASDIGNIYFCGAQSIVVSYGQNLRSTKRTETDYDFISGVGFEELYSYEKPLYADKNVDPVAPPRKQVNMINSFVKLT